MGLIVTQTTLLPVEIVTGANRYNLMPHRELIHKLLLEFVGFKGAVVLFVNPTTGFSPIAFLPPHQRSTNGLAKMVCHKWYRQPDRTGRQR